MNKQTLEVALYNAFINLQGNIFDSMEHYAKSVAEHMAKDLMLLEDTPKSTPQTEFPNKRRGYEWL